MGLAGFYFLFSRYQLEVKKREHAKEIEIQLNQAKNAYLLSQINPHLLFNTLNFIYQKVFESSPQAADMVMTLSDIMRYTVNLEFPNLESPLQGELIQVENLIRLHLSRLEDERCVDFQYDAKVNSIKFIPLVVITLVENVFKHGKLNDKANPATIKITYRENELKISTTNLINRGRKIPSLNKGIANIKERLEFAYGSNATISINSENEVFKLSITVRINAEITLEG